MSLVGTLIQALIVLPVVGFTVLVGYKAGSSEYDSRFWVYIAVWLLAVVVAALLWP